MVVIQKVLVNNRVSGTVQKNDDGIKEYFVQKVVIWL